jgi:hypothetical protein
VRVPLAAVAFVGCTVGSPTDALAQSFDDADLHAHLSLDSSPSCSSRESLAARVAESIGRDAFVGAVTSADLVITGVIRRQGGGWSARLQLSTPGGSPLGEREIFESGQDCDVLDEPLSLVLSLIVDSPAVRQAVVEAKEREGPGWGFAVGLGARGAIGVLPDPALGFELLLELRTPSFVAIRLTAGGLLPVGATDGMGTVDLHAIDATLGICPAFSVASWLRFGGCVGARGGVFRARGRGLDENLSVDRAIFDLVGDLELVAHAGFFEVGLGVGGGFALIRDQFYYARADGSMAVLYERPLGFGEARLFLGAGF